jgi:pimeloyl-ACP methyl ester carboxylesterase
MTADERQRRVSRGTLLGLAVVGGLLLALAIDVVRTGGFAPWLARYGLPPIYVPQGERHDIGDRSLYLDCRGSGSPTVVLEAGSGADSATWSAVHDTLASTTRTCAYDRAGRARSDGTEPHTLADAAAQLHTLLDVAGVPGPFVVVGHSLGGSYARVFADAYREDTAGVVLVDSFEPDLQDDFVHPLLGDLRPEYEAGLDSLRAHVSHVDSLDWAASEVQLRASSLEGIPLEVLRAARYEPRLDQATNERIAAAWEHGFRSLEPETLTYTVVPRAGHHIQIDRPEVVIEAVRRLVAAARAG